MKQLHAPFLKLISLTSTYDHPKEPEVTCGDGEEVVVGGRRLNEILLFFEVALLASPYFYMAAVRDHRRNKLGPLQVSKL